MLLVSRDVRMLSPLRQSKKSEHHCTNDYDRQDGQ